MPGSTPMLGKASVEVCRVMDVKLNSTPWALNMKVVEDSGYKIAIRNVKANLERNDKKIRRKLGRGCPFRLKRLGKIAEIGI